MGSAAQCACPGQTRADTDWSFGAAAVHPLTWVAVRRPDQATAPRRPAPRGSRQHPGRTECRADDRVAAGARSRRTCQYRDRGRCPSGLMHSAARLSTAVECGQGGALKDHQPPRAEREKIWSPESEATRPDLGKSGPRRRRKTVLSKTGGLQDRASKIAALIVVGAGTRPQPYCPCTGPPVDCSGGGGSDSSGSVLGVVGGLGAAGRSITWGTGQRGRQPGPLSTSVLVVVMAMRWTPISAIAAAVRWPAQM